MLIQQIECFFKCTSKCFRFKQTPTQQYTKCSIALQWLPSLANCKQGSPINLCPLDCLQVWALCCTYQSLGSHSRGYRTAAWAAGRATAHPAWARRAARAEHRKKACGGAGGACLQDEVLEAQHRGPDGLRVPGLDLAPQSHRRAACMTWPHPCLGDEKRRVNRVAVCPLAVSKLARKVVSASFP